MNAKELLVWVDTETTGIIPSDNLLLELAIIITDNSLNELYRRNFIVEHAQESIEAHLCDYTRTMHSENGSLAELADPTVEKISLSELDKALAVILEYHGIEKFGVLAGNSIHFDRGYIRECLPEFESKLHFRMLDVSAIAIAASRGILELGEPTKKYAHRVMDDICESITELQGYQK